jgi:hypothetical protein
MKRRTLILNFQQYRPRFWGVEECNYVVKTAAEGGTRLFAVLIRPPGPSGMTQVLGVVHRIPRGRGLSWPHRGAESWGDLIRPA